MDIHGGASGFRDRNIQLAIDDFGTGYYSLSDLKHRGRRRSARSSCEGCDIAQGHLYSPPVPAEEIGLSWRRWQPGGTRR